MALLGCAFCVSSAVSPLLISLRPQFSIKFCSLFGKVLPALGGKHTFASCFDVRSSKSASWPSHFDEKRTSWTYKLHVEVCTIHCKNPNCRFGGICRISKFAKSIGKMCISCLWPPLGCAFCVSSAASSLLISLRPQFSIKFCSFFGKVLPALGGKHTFASCFGVRSSKRCLLALPFRRKSGILDRQLAHGSLHNPLQKSQFTVLGVFVARQNLQNSVEKCVFLAYGPAWGGPKAKLKAKRSGPKRFLFQLSSTCICFSVFLEKVLLARGGKHIFKMASRKVSAKKTVFDR